MMASCVSCQYTDKTANTAPAPLIPVDFPSRPWERVGIDITGPFDCATWDCHFAMSLNRHLSAECRQPSPIILGVYTGEARCRWISPLIGPKCGLSDPRKGRPNQRAACNGVGNQTVNVLET